MAARIPVARLKASHRKISRRGGRKQLTLDLPGEAPKIVFRSVHREGARFRLLKAGPLPERGLGGVYTNPRTIFEREPELKAIRREAADRLPETVHRLILETLAKRKR